MLCMLGSVFLLFNVGVVELEMVDVFCFRVGNGGGEWVGWGSKVFHRTVLSY